MFKVHANTLPCSVEGCKNLQRARGFCKCHYWKWSDQVRPKCSVEGCRRAQRWGGYCDNHNKRLQKYGTADTPVNPQMAMAINGQIQVAGMLRQYGREVSEFPYHHPFDLLVDGWRVDVKTAKAPTADNPRFMFLFQRRRSHAEDPLIDFYVLRVEGLACLKGKPLHLLLKVPAGKMGVSISLASLVRGEWADEWNSFNLFLMGQFGVKPSLEASSAA